METPNFYFLHNFFSKAEQRADDMKAEKKAVYQTFNK